MSRTVVRVRQGGMSGAPMSHWGVRPRASDAELRALGLDSPLLAQLLLNRGLSSADAAAHFLAADDNRLADPFSMAGLTEALDRIAVALAKRERVVVYGDYDVDGLSGATLLALALRSVGIEAAVFIPHRERDGYGLNGAVLGGLAASETGLVISVDCGISAAVEVAAAALAGLDVIVTDHHQVPAELPRAVAVLNPHRPECRYPFKQLAGAGVAFRLAEAIVRRFARREQVSELGDRLVGLAALGTVADVMPLVGENRTIVSRGLRHLNERASPGLRALSRLAKLQPGWIDAESIAFKLAPRLNAAGRIDDAILAHRLLAADTDAEASVLAGELEGLNARRRLLTDQAMVRARAEVATFGSDLPPAIVIAGEYPAGLLGLLAARLAEELRRPTAVIQIGQEVCRGSVRGVPGFDVVAGVGACQELLLGFGGHSGAAGLSLAPRDVDAFRDRFPREAASALAALPPPGPFLADCRLRPESINWSLFEVLDQLEPSGQGNPTATFETRRLFVTQSAVVGGRHLRLSLAADRVRLRGIMFDGADSGPASGQWVDLLYRARRNVWQDSVSIELDVVAWRPSAGS